MTRIARLSDAELLSLRFCDLSLNGLGALLSRARSALENDLERAGLRFRPHLWLSDEWFCPDGSGGFAVPFYLAHPRLRRLERKMMLEVEGGTPRTCLRLMRHEAGHAVDNAYRLRRRRGRARLFGPAATAYPEFYAPKPYSRRFVRHLDHGYAQSHPDEDFAETFAVWLDPSSRWQERYAEWPALAKLRFVDELMQDVASAPPALSNRRTPGALVSLRTTLDEHYRAQQERYRVRLAESYDEDLRTLFSTSGPLEAAAFLRSQRAALRALIAAWTGLRRYTVDQVVRDWIERARAMRLYAAADDEPLRRATLAALTVRAMQYLQSGHYRVVV